MEFMSERLKRPIGPGPKDDDDKPDKPAKVQKLALKDQREKKIREDYQKALAFLIISPGNLVPFGP